MAVVFGGRSLLARQDFELVRQNLASRVESGTGFVLEIRGGLELPYSLWPVVVFRDVVLSNPDTDTGEDLLVAETLEVAIEILSLLKGEIVVHQASLTTVELNLDVDKGGSANWISATAGTGEPVQFTLHALDFQDIDLSFRNLRTGVEFGARIDSLSAHSPDGTGPIEVAMSTRHFGEPMSVRARLNTGDEILAGQVFPVDLSADIEGIDVAVTGRLDRIEDGEMTSLRLDLEAVGANLGDMGGLLGTSLPETGDFSISTIVAMAEETLSVSNIAAGIAVGDSHFTIHGDVRDVGALRGVDVVLEGRGEDLEGLSGLVDWALPTTDSFEFDGRLIGGASGLSVSDLNSVLEQGQHRVMVSGEVDDIVELSGLDWRIDAVGTDLSEFNEMFSLGLPVTESYRGSAAISGDAGALSARDIVIDGTAPGLTLTLKGAIGRIVELKDMDLAMQFGIDNLSSLNPYLGTRLPDSEPIEASGRLTGSAADLKLEDFVLQRGPSLVKGSVGIQTGERLTVVGSVSSGVLELSPYLSNFRERADVRMVEKSGRFFSDEPLDLSFLDPLDAHFTLDNLRLLSGAGNMTVSQATVELSQGNLSIGPLVLVRNESTISGHLRVDRQQQILIVDADLSIENVDLRTFLQDIRRSEIYDGKFDFAIDVRSSGNSVRELMANLDSQQMRLVGGGTIDLGAETLDVRLSPRPRHHRMLGHNIDALLTGPLADPKVSTAGALKTVATDYGKFVLLGPIGLLIPTEKSLKHPCVGSLQEYRQQQSAVD